MKSFEDSFETLANEMVPPASAANRPVQATQPTQREEVREVEEAVPESMDGPINPRLVCLLDPRSEHAESYYRLRYKIETRRRSDAALVVGITSAGKGEGKTLTGINLAGALAKDSGTQVLLLDLNLRHDSEGVADYLGLQAREGQGVVEWIRETEYGYEQFVHYLHTYNLHVMTAGGDAELPYELLKSDRLDQLIRRARRDYDFVIVDTPQILKLPDTELVSRFVDGFVIVVKADTTRQERLEEALNLMTPDKVLGMVFNADTGNH